MRISDWSSDVCSSDLGLPRLVQADAEAEQQPVDDEGRAGAVPDTHDEEGQEEADGTEPGSQRRPTGDPQRLLRDRLDSVELEPVGQRDVPARPEFEEVKGQLRPGEEIVRSSLLEDVCQQVLLSWFCVEFIQE